MIVHDAVNAINTDVEKLSVELAELKIEKFTIAVYWNTMNSIQFIIEDLTEMKLDLNRVYDQYTLDNEIALEKLNTK